MISQNSQIPQLFVNIGTKKNTSTMDNHGTMGISPIGPIPTAPSQILLELDFSTRDLNFFFLASHFLTGFGQRSKHLRTASDQSLKRINRAISDQRLLFQIIPDDSRLFQIIPIVPDYSRLLIISATIINNE